MKMGRLLLSVDQFERFTLSVSESLDLIDVFLGLGWQVDVVTSTYGKALSFELERLLQHKAFRIISDKHGEFAENYQLVWIYRGFFSEKLLSILSDFTRSAPVIFRHFYDYNDVYMPWGAELENELASVSLSLSPIISERLVQNGLLEKKLHLLPYTASQEFTIPHSSHSETEIKKILYFAPDLSAEMYELQQQLKSQSVTLEWFDCSNPVSRIYADWLRKYDVIIGSDEIVPKALMLGIPVFLASTSYVEGYLGEHNINDFEASHFTVVNLRFCPDTDEWIELLKKGFSGAQNWTLENQSEFQRKWQLGPAIEALLSVSMAASNWMLSENSRHALRFHSQSILSWADKTYSIEQWLKERCVTNTRRQALLSFIASVPESGDIGVVIVDEKGDNQACVRSLNAIKKQTLVPALIHLISVKDIVLEEEHIKRSERNLSFEVNELINKEGPAAILFVMAGDELLPDALLLFAEQRLRHPNRFCWYGDETYIDAISEPGVILRPDPNVDLLRCTPYVGRTILLDRLKASKMSGMSEMCVGIGIYELIWRGIEQQGTEAIGHLAEVIVKTDESSRFWYENETLTLTYQKIVKDHLDRLGVPAVIENGKNTGFSRVRYHWQQRPLISIVIPTRDHLTLLRACIDSLMEKTRYPHYELLIVNNLSTDPQTCEFLKELEALKLEQIRVLHFDAPFNFAAINNRAAEHANGEVLLFLNNDCQIIEADWLDALIEHALRPEIAFVGARLEYQDGRIQHGGYLLGIQNGVDNPWDGADGETRGFQRYLQTEHNLSAVSAACMMVRKEVFFNLGGFDEQNYPLYFADVDVGLRAIQQGYLNVWTPWARIRHMGGATRLLTEKFNVQERPLLQDYIRLRSQWRSRLLQDPSYHPHMQRMGKAFTLGPGTARSQQPLPGRPLPVVLAHHVDWQGCGNHRILQPFKAMESHFMIEGGMTQDIPGVMEVAQLQPDVILLESLSGSRFPSIMGQYRDVCDAKIVVEYDDYLLNVPLKNGNRNHFPQHIIKNLRRVMEFADWVVVSTAPLADAYSRFHTDIRIAQNRLAEKQWGHLHSKRGVGKKIRIGWAGGGSHAGDLEILLPIIKAMENKVEWVFMGMKPRGVHCEFHPGVPFDMYPEKLASLNLDLALVPLTINQFNECKSNLRLLEIGTCGVPIIATDIEPYRCGLPVTLVENRFKDWMAAINSHLSDMQQTYRLGDQLREIIHNEWYLRGNGLKDWQAAWSKSE